MYKYTRPHDFYHNALDTQHLKYQKTGHGSYEKVPIRGNYKVKSRTMVKYKRKKNKKRRGRKRRYIPRAIQPKTKLVRLKVCDFQQLTGTGGALTRLSIQGNSFDDPLTGSSGQQPLGYDQWKALYLNAYVVGTKVKATFHNESTDSVMIGISPMSIPQGSTSLGSYEYYRELPGTNSRLLSPEMDHTTLVSKRSTKRHLKFKNITDEDDLKIDMVNETPPNKLYYFHVWTQATDQTSTVNVECVVDIEYIILLTDPIIPSRSVET